MSSTFSLNWARRTKVAEPFVSVLTFPKGYIGTIPSVRASKRGGWIYHPLEGTDKKPVTLGRADEGREKAANLIEFLVKQTYETNNWDIPINAVPPVSADEADKSWGREGAAVVFPVKNYGYVKLGISQERSTWNSTDKSWHFDMSIPTVIATALAKQVIELTDVSMGISVDLTDTKDIEAVSDMFISNPLLGYAKALERFGNSTGTIKTYNRRANLGEIPVMDIVDMLEHLEPIYGFVPERWTEASESWSGAEFHAKNPDGTEGSLEAGYTISKAFLMASPKYRTVKVNQSFVDTAETLKVAFEALGVEFEILTSTNKPLNGGSYETVIDGIEISVPAGKGGDRHNREGHTFKITNTGIKVKCGYVTNEENYIDDASRQALSDMKTLLEG
ncbi:MAG: hypothetical protein DRP42_04100 [Tenericutes bacterium]|nr:MAG: hypothetical protein DRP42_04100 [Mycoplasmatota bacterium]